MDHLDGRDLLLMADKILNKVKELDHPHPPRVLAESLRLAANAIDSAENVTSLAQTMADVRRKFK